MSIPVYRKGSWIHYTLPDSGIALWSQSLKLQAASIYASAIVKGYSPDTSHILAESYVTKKIYGVQYNPTIERYLEKLCV
jgi:hypothetical protein